MLLVKDDSAFGVHYTRMRRDEKWLRHTGAEVDAFYHEVVEYIYNRHGIFSEQSNRVYRHPLLRTLDCGCKLVNGVNRIVHAHPCRGPGTFEEIL